MTFTNSVTEVYLMPWADKTLYWYGWLNDIIETVLVENGWYYQNATLIEPTFNANNIYLTQAINPNKGSGIGVNTPIVAEKVKLIFQSTGGSGYAWACTTKRTLEYPETSITLFSHGYNNADKTYAETATNVSSNAYYSFAVGSGSGNMTLYACGYE